MSTPPYHQSGQSSSLQNNLEFDLHHVAQHNAQQVEHQGYDEAGVMVAGLPSYQEPEPIDMSLNSYSAYREPPHHDLYSHHEDQYRYLDEPLHTPPPMRTPRTPRSNAADGGRSTRSGRALRRTDSPLSSDTRVKKPKAKARKVKKPLPPEYQPPGPFTELDASVWGEIALKEVDKRAEWSREERKSQATKKDGRISRPMNAFMLYRSAWADRCKAFFDVTNHQLVSKIMGASWAMESANVKEHWTKLSGKESDNHKVHLPNYRYQPSKPATKMDNNDSGVEDYDVDDEDPDGSYMPPGNKRQTKIQPTKPAQPESGTQYGQDSYGYPIQMNMSVWDTLQSAMPQQLPYAQALPYPQGGQYLQSRPHYQFQGTLDDMRLMTGTTASTYSGNGLVGLPGGQSQDMVQTSRTQTPLQNYPHPQVGGTYMDQNGMLYQERGFQPVADANYEIDFGNDSQFAEAMGGTMQALAPSELLQPGTNWLDPSLGDDVETEYSALALKQP